MIAQQQDRPSFGALQDPRALVAVDRDAFEVVIRDLAVELRGVEVRERETVLQAAHGLRRGRVQMHHAVGLG